MNNPFKYTRVSNIDHHVLSLWDRLFNRHVRTVKERGKETWHRTRGGVKVPNSEFTRNWVEYEVTDRVNGSVTILKEYIE